MLLHHIFLFIEIQSGWRASIWRHQGKSRCNSVSVFQWNLFDEWLWSVKSIWWDGWRLSLRCRITVPPKENYICLTANDCIFIAISASPFIRPSPPIPHCIFKYAPYSCACLRGIHVCKEEEGVKHKKYHACVSCILRSKAFQCVALWWSFSFCCSVYLDKSDIIFLSFPTSASVDITICKRRICLCKYAAITERFPLMWLHSPSTYNFGH